MARGRLRVAEVPQTSRLRMARSHLRIAMVVQMARVLPSSRPRMAGEPDRKQGGGDGPLYIKMAARAAPSRLSSDSPSRSSADGPTGARTGGELWGAHWDQNRFAYRRWRSKRTNTAGGLGRYTSTGQVPLALQRPACCATTGADGRDSAQLPFIDKVVDTLVGAETDLERLFPQTCVSHVRRGPLRGSSSCCC